MDCPCGSGPGLAEDAAECPSCGLELEPLHRLRAAPLEEYREAVELWEREEPFAALVRLKTVLAAAPDHVGARLLLAEILRSMGRWEEVVEQCQAILLLDPEYPGVQKMEAEARRAMRSRRSPGEAALAGRRHRVLWALGLALLLALGAALALWPRAEPAEPLTLAEAVEAVRQEIGEREDLARLDVRVEAARDRVLLAGEVPQEEHRRLLLDLAREKAHPFPVEDGLAVAADEEEADLADREPEPFTYRVRPGETLPFLAWRFYGQSALWPRIWDANRDALPHPDRLEAGTVLIIPPLGLEEGPPGTD